MGQTNIVNTLIEKQIREILEKLTEKRGKHSELWMWPKEESLNEATQAIMALAEKREKEVVGEIKSNLSELTQYPASQSRTETNYVVLLDQVYKCLPIKEENPYGK